MARELTLDAPSMPQSKVVRHGSSLRWKRKLAGTHGVTGNIEHASQTHDSPCAEEKIRIAPVAFHRHTICAEHVVFRVELLDDDDAPGERLTFTRRGVTVHENKRIACGE
jgi:hypothetical protein